MRRRAALGVACLWTGLAVDGAWALPTGDQVVACAAVVSTSGPGQLNIKQSSDKTIINWQSFGIGRGESVDFRQPNASSIALNRVIGANPSEIFGRLTANGQVFLVNPNGILFAPGASVDVGGLVASTLGIANQDFLAGKHKFSNEGSAGSVVNQGSLSAAPGGYIALIAPVVSNSGSMQATSGSVGLAAGDKVTLDFNGDNLLKIKVDAAAVSAQIDNSGTISADGGRVQLTARAADKLLSTVINNGGAIEARSMVRRGGEIVLEASDPVANSVAEQPGQGQQRRRQRGQQRHA